MWLEQMVCMGNMRECAHQFSLKTREEATWKTYIDYIKTDLKEIGCGLFSFGSRLTALAGSVCR
jgi:predicted nucleic acid-binding Zn finger protein